MYCLPKMLSRTHGRIAYLLKYPRVQKQFSSHSLKCNFVKLLTSSRLTSSSAHINNDCKDDSRSEEKFNKNCNKDLSANFEKPDHHLSADHDPDVFGTLDKNFLLEKKLDEMPDEEDDKTETVFYDEKRERIGRLSINKYGKIIKYFLNKKKLSNAIDVLETRMLKEDKVKPDNYIYNLLISGCAKFGYTKKAFQLFNQMKKRGLQPKPSTYTSLFNACSNSPWTHDGIKRITRLREIMLEKGHVPNQKNYHAMIKAYGHCKDLEKAFYVVDEMIENKVFVNCETYNFLLQSCISDNEAGLRHALWVWHKMMSRRIKPDLFSFNLLLRCTRDCGLGSIEATNDVIQALIGSTNVNVNNSSESSSSNLSDKTYLEDNNSTENSGNELMKGTVANNLPIENDNFENRPNLISKRPHLGNIIGLTDIKLPEHRLLLLGGCEGFLREMKLNCVNPDIKTFTQLIETIPSTLAAEESLLKCLESFKVEPDIDFFNILIKKRSMRNDYSNAREVLKLLQGYRISPDIVTFGVLALTCLKLEDAIQLYSDMDEIGYRMNIEILGALLRNGCVSWDTDYIIHVMKWVLDENITPSPTFMKYLKQFYSTVVKYQTINDNGEHKKLSNEEKKFIGKINDQEFMKKFKNYCRFYKIWTTRAIPEEPPHPYAQFENKQELEDPEDVKIMNTGRSSR